LLGVFVTAVLVVVLEAVPAPVAVLVESLAAPWLGAAAGLGLAGALIASFVL
jgi:hypothetical protein